MIEKSPFRENSNNPITNNRQTKRQKKKTNKNFEYYGHSNNNGVSKKVVKNSPS